MAEAKIVGGRYTIEDSIGDGGMGMVYRGRDLESGNYVAIKALKDEIIQNAPILLERFSREGEMLRELNHPNIVKVLASIEEDGNHYLVMEYVGGGSLKDVLRRVQTIPIKQVLRIGLGMADALTRTHELGIIHRDVKPSNVLLTEGGTPRLTDFGVAQTNESNITKTGALMGTLLYLSPEAFMRHDLDARTDIWSFGVSLYELMTGQRPFYGENMMEVMQAVLKEDMPDLEKLRPDAPLPLIDLVERMLERNRAARIATMREVGAELEDILRSLPATSPRLQLAAHLTSAAHDEAMRFAIMLPPVGQDAALPPDLTPFVDRGRELRTLKQALHDPVTRIISLVGAAGVGKSRLAIEVARQQEKQFENGVFYINLDGVRSVDHAFELLRHQVGCTAEGREARDVQLLEFLRYKKLLLVLDGLDSLEELGRLLDQVRAHAPGVTMLCTKHEAIGTVGESVVPIDPFDLRIWKKLRTALEYGATHIFLDTIRQQRPSYEIPKDELDAFNALMAFTGGIPIVIELAASATLLFGMKTVLERLERAWQFSTNDLPHIADDERRVRVFYDVALDGLNPDLRPKLSKMSLFFQGFDRIGAESVGALSLAELRHLKRAGLISREPSGRYRFAPALRAIAEEYIRGDDDLYRRSQEAYCNYFADFVRRRKYDLRGYRQRRAIAEFRQDFVNIRRAWEFGIERQFYRAIGRMSETLGLYLVIDQRYAEGREMLRPAQDLMSSPEASSNLNLVSRLINLYGAFLGLSTTRNDEANNLLVEGMNLSRARHNLSELAFSHYYLALFAEDQDETLKQLEAGLEAAANAPDKFWEVRLQIQLSEWHATQGRSDRFDEWNQHAQMTAQQAGDHLGEILALNSLAAYAALDGEHKLALQALGDLLTYYESIGDRWNALQVAHGMAVAAFKRGRSKQMSKAMTLAIRLSRETAAVGLLAALLGLQALKTSIESHFDELAHVLPDADEAIRRSQSQLGQHRLHLALAHQALVQDELGTAERQIIAATLLSGNHNSADLETGLTVLAAALLNCKQDDFPQAARLLAMYFRLPQALQWLDRVGIVEEVKKTLSAELPEDSYREIVAATREADLDAALAETIQSLKIS